MQRMVELYPELEMKRNKPVRLIISNQFIELSIGRVGITHYKKFEVPGSTTIIFYPEDVEVELGGEYMRDEPYSYG